MADKLRKVQRKNYTDEAFLGNEVIDGRRTWSLDEKLYTESFDAKHVAEMNAEDVTFKFVQQSGLSHPIIVKTNCDRLGLKVTPCDFTIGQIKQSVGGRRIIDVVDVPSQKELSMTMKEFCDYYETVPRTQLLNVLSLEFSQTKLESFVESPFIVRQLDWVTTVWPQYLKQCQREQTNNVELMKYPKVQKYCLMSVAACWTDFHVDFGGTSVWYHVVRGEKTFFIIPPTKENMSAFEEWTLSGRQDDIFFGDVAKSCQRITLQPGWTFFLPCGWIHAVHTVKDSLVYGGNFIHSFQIPMQLKVMDLENRIHVPLKFRYPFLQEMYWYVLARYMYVLTGKDILLPISESDIAQIVKCGDIEKEYMVKNGTVPFTESSSPVLLTELEYIGLRQLTNWLLSLPPSKRCIPPRISDPDKLLLEVMSEIDNHAADDWAHAINGKPLLQGFETVMTVAHRQPKVNIDEREPVQKKNRLLHSTSPNKAVLPTRNSVNTSDLYLCGSSVNENNT